MDPIQLSQQIVQFLAPFLPYLLKMGEQAAEEAAKKLGAASPLPLGEGPGVRAPRTPSPSAGAR